MAKHFTGIIQILESETPVSETKYVIPTRGGTPEKKDVREVAKVVMRVSDIHQLVSRLKGHLDLISGDPLRESVEFKGANR